MVAITHILLVFNAICQINVSLSFQNHFLLYKSTVILSILNVMVADFGNKYFLNIYVASGFKMVCKAVESG